MKNRNNLRGPGGAKGRAALSAQQSIPYVAMHPDGVCQLPGGLYTKTVEYEDINYSVASTEDQSAIFSGWSSFLNYFDSSLPFQLSDRLLREILELDAELTVTLHIQTVDQLKAIKTVKGKISDIP